MVSDPISDFLARIKNAHDRKQESISLPATKIIVAVAEILKEEGFIVDYSVEDLKPQKKLNVDLKYVNGMPAINGLKRISKPGVRRYYGYREIKPVKHGLGVSIFSTPKGVISGKQAVKEKIGGEYLCYVY